MGFNSAFKGLKDFLTEGTKCLSIFNFPWSLQENTRWCLIFHLF